MTRLTACERCSAPFTRGQTRFCSHRCAALTAADAVRLAPKLCEYPPCQRLYAPRRQTQKFCSRPCADLGKAVSPEFLSHQTTGRECTTRAEILAILEANKHTWLTTSDLAIWVYG